MSFVSKLGLLAAVCAVILTTNMASAQEVKSVSSYAIELESTNPFPDTKVYAFLRMEKTPGADEALLVPLIKKGGDTVVRISFYAQTKFQKPTPLSFNVVYPRPEVTLGVEATCRCIDSPLVSSAPFEYEITLALDMPLATLYVKDNQGVAYGPYAVRPVDVANLKPVSAFGLQNIVNQE